MPQALTDAQRKAIHDLALAARELLTREARELLEGTYGLYPDGRIDPPEKLPQVQANPETAETYHRLAQFLDDEERAGLPRPQAVEKLVKEVAFTHLNRLVAFKMMEARKLIRGTLDKGADSNAFKFYLADPDHADDLARYERGDADTAYRHFLLWQSGQVAQEVRVLFDPDTLPSRLFPRARTLNDLLEMLNQPDLAAVWPADETIGWVYQYFNEPELQAAFEKVRTSGAKFEAKDIPSATQLFTPHWIVRFLVHNTLGRLWVRMHPDTRLVDTGILDYLVPLEGEQIPEPLQPVREITLLDPACGGMHFGLVAFDLFAAMYQEELDRAGDPGWPKNPSVTDPADIPAAIIEHNLFGIDIDLRAVQLSALALYLKAKSLNPKARIADSNLACADVLPLDGARLGTFLREARFTRPIYERLIRALWNRLKEVSQLGSLLRLELELGDLIAEERARYAKAPLFAGLPGEFEREAAEEEFWDIISAQIIQGLDEFVRQQAQAGADLTFFAGEAVKGLRLLDLMFRRYDVVVTNPPYMSRRKMNKELADLVADAYPEGKGDVYAAFIQRCLEYAENRGYVGILTMHSFMFISSYEALRERIRRQAALEAMAHCGPGLFDVGNPGTLQTTAFALRKEPETVCREGNLGTYFRLVHEPDCEAKRQAVERALQDGSNTYQVAQRRFDAIPGSPWLYWMSESLRTLFESLGSLSQVAESKVGINTGCNERFRRWHWEIPSSRRSPKWRPYVSGGPGKKFYGNLFYVLNWSEEEMLGYHGSALRARDYQGREGLTYGLIGSAGPTVRHLPPGYFFSSGGNCVFPDDPSLLLALLGVMNSSFAVYLFKTINPTINLSVGDIAALPISISQPDSINRMTLGSVWTEEHNDTIDEATIDFISSPRWDTGPDDLVVAQARLASLERQIDDEVYRLYGISDEDRAAIEAELSGGPITEDDTEDATGNTDDQEEPEPPMTVEELAVRWISYAVGIVLGRFQPGGSPSPQPSPQRGEGATPLPGREGLGEGRALGSAIYHRQDFAVGSLPVPDEAEFDQLVGPAERFAYVDTDGGRHLFPAQVEAALRDLAVPDGITVLDKGHPRDLPTLVDNALTLMLGAEATQEVMAEGASGDLRKFLERNFFTKWHFKWYRKRPVYWPLQSAKRSYGFVLFHEHVNRSTLYVLQRDYLDHKLNGLRLHIGDLTAQLAGEEGLARKQVERQIDKATQVLDEIAEFAQTMERVVREGYEPAPDWIDDGVILRLAPLWELIPIWWREPKKYWECLQQGDYDWSHIAMRYWPERVREKCKTNKSFAIAHGHEEWYQEDR